MLRLKDTKAKKLSYGMILEVKNFRKMVGDEWTPGKNCRFDPIASKKASELGMKVICAGGKNISNIQAILEDKEYFGTTIG